MDWRRGVAEQRAMAERGQELWSALSRREQDRVRTAALAGEVGTTADDCLLLAHSHRELGRARWSDRVRWLPLAALLDLPLPWERRHTVARRRNLDRARQLSG